MKKQISNLMAVSLFFTQFSYASPQPINSKTLEKVASTAALSTTDARVIIDNDEAFRSKLEAIKKATTSIDMIYYIYSNDYSSAVITQELMEKARKGVKVRLILDYLTNLKNADLLLTMQKAGVEIKLYNKPTDNIKRDAVYVTTPCLNGAKGALCIQQKDKKSKELLTSNNGTDFMSRLFLTGLYAKNMDLLKISVLEGQEINLEALKASQAGSTSQEDQEQLKKFAKLLFQAKIKNSLGAKFKLWLAFQAYGEKLTPLYNLITESLPLSSDGTSAKDWTYLSDYTHHKFLLVDQKFIQLGGRNIEDSYHMKANDLVKGEDKKYIFMDTDFAAEVSAYSGQEITSTFNRLWDLNWMVSDLREVDSISELDALTQTDLLAKALQLCKGESRRADETNGACIERQFRLITSKNSPTRTARLNLLESEIQKKASTYYRDHKMAVNETDRINDQGGRFSDLDKKNSKIYYIENLPFARLNWFDKLMGATEPVRQYGADLNSEYKSNKNIHELLIRGLENVCSSRNTSASKDIVLHNAYFFPPPNVMRAFGKMMNGEWDCHDVTVTILTNSYETTDLFPVNALASTQFKAMFTVNAEEIRKENKRAAKFRLLEYKKQSQGDERSLHSKVSLIGDDLIVGSANMDIRSYAMDTNNGVYIQNARDLARNYRDFIDALITGQIKDEKGQVKFVIQDRTEEMTSNETKEQFIEKQIAILQYAASQFQTGRKFIGDEAKPETRSYYLKMLRSMLNFIYGVTLGGLDHKRIAPPNNLKRNMTNKDMENFQKSEQYRLEKMIQNLLSTI